MSDSEKLQSWQTQLANLTQERAQLLNYIPPSTMAQTVSSKSRQIRTLEEVQTYLSAESILVNYIQGESNNYLLVIHKERLVVHMLDKTVTPEGIWTRDQARQIITEARVETVIILSSERPNFNTISTSFPDIELLAFEDSELSAWLDGAE